MVTGEGSGTLTQFADDVWLVEGPVVRFLRYFPYPTRMVVVRLPGGGLWLWSPVAATAELTAAIRTIGPVREIVSPNKLHHLFLDAWVAAFPEARLHEPPGLARRRPDLRFAAPLTDAADPAWAGVVEPVVVRGSFAMEEVVFFHRPSRAAIVGDLVQRLAPRAGWSGMLMRADGLVGARGSTPREWRLSFWNRRAARAARDRLLRFDPERLVIAHGACAATGAREILAQALSWMG